jgi:hypothetical protein
MLKARINKKKNAKCDITIEDLLEGVNNFGEL